MDKREKLIQKNLIFWALSNSLETPELAWLHHIPNGEKRNPAVARELVAMGVRSGVYDLFLPVPRGKAHGLYIEVKTETGTLSKAQRDFKKFAEAQGYVCETMRSLDEGVQIIKGYLNVQ